MGATSPIVRLSELEPGGQGDCFALLAAKDQATTRDGKPYYRVTFRDRIRSATAMIWQDSPWFEECDGVWQVGRFYKLRCRFSETQYGLQIDLDAVREVIEDDTEEGFDATEFHVRSRYDPEVLFDELVTLAETHISDVPLRQLVLELLNENADALKRLPAATRNHHAFSGGFVEHVLSVTKTALHLAEKYADDYRQIEPPLSISLVVAGAILHDIGKLIELDVRPESSTYTARGRLIGHILLGRDLVRDKAAEIAEFDAEILLRLEHIIVSHQNLPEWGSSIAPHTPEALLVHYADDIDAKFQMMAHVLDQAATSDEEFTDRNNPLRRAIFRGWNVAEPDA
ncbi:MAG: HD domain-containing protein [Planctomycetaceae bacterium]